MCGVGVRGPVEVLRESLEGSGGQRAHERSLRLPPLPLALQRGKQAHACRGVEVTVAVHCVGEALQQQNVSIVCVFLAGF